MLVPVLARTPLLGERAVTAALIAVGVLSFVLWMHHMFTAGLGPWTTALVSAASLAIALPGALQVFAWIGTLARGQLLWCTSSLFVLGFLALFALGGLTGVMVAVLPFDRQAHDSYFIGCFRSSPRSTTGCRWSTGMRCRSVSGAGCSR